MVDYHRELVTALDTILPTYYELKLTSSAKIPCISYLELNNHDLDTGDTLGYSAISFQVKVWGTSLADLQKYSKEIDKKLRPLGFKRTSSGELFDNNSAMIQKILTYEAIASETY